jgi:hypothetical protein
MGSLDAPRLDGGLAALHALGTSFDESARQLQALEDDLLTVGAVASRRSFDEVRSMVSSRVVTVVAPLDAAIEHALQEIAELFASLVEEGAALADFCQSAPHDPATRALCDRRPEVDGAYDYLQRTRATRTQFNQVGGELLAELGDLLDAHAVVVVDSATGRGPGDGQPCGPEDLCAEGLRCLVLADGGPRTCERECSPAAKEPWCPAGGHCVGVGVGLTGLCRPP